MQKIIGTILLLALASAPAFAQDSRPKITVAGLVESVRLCDQDPDYVVVSIAVRLTVGNDDSVSIIVPKADVIVDYHRFGRDLKRLAAANTTHTGWYQTETTPAPSAASPTPDFAVLGPGDAIDLHTELRAVVKKSDVADLKLLDLQGENWLYSADAAESVARRWAAFGVPWRWMIASGPIRIDLTTAKTVVDCDATHN